MRNPQIDALDRANFDLTTTKFSVWMYSEHAFRALSKDKWLSSRLNTVLKVYPKGTRFLDSDEPVFPFTESQLPRVLKVLGVKL
jgi:hypothetical protein